MNLLEELELIIKAVQDVTARVYSLRAIEIQRLHELREAQVKAEVNAMTDEQVEERLRKPT